MAPDELGLLPLLRGAKAARAGARATRLVKLVRLIRLIRFVKVLSFFNGTTLDDDHGDSAQKGIRYVYYNTVLQINLEKVVYFLYKCSLLLLFNIAAQHKPSRVGEILSEQISRRVVVLVLLVLFVAPQLQVETDQLTSQQLLLKAMRAMPETVRQGFIDDYYLSVTTLFITLTDSH